jgi:soluble cytochrome b562
MRSPPREERRAALKALGRLLAEADSSLSEGDVAGTEAALKKVGKAFDVYWSRDQEAVRGMPPPTPIVAERRHALRTLASALRDIDQSLSNGSLPSVKASLLRAKDVVDQSRMLEEPNRSSEIRYRLPHKIAKIAK